MRIALDSNVLAYAVGVNDVTRKAIANQLLARLVPEDVLIPVQALGELFHVLVIKAGLKSAEAKPIVLKWCDQYSVIETSYPALLSAMELASDHRVRIWDAIIFAAAASAHCRLLLSEDLQDGFSWNGVTVVNPFAEEPNPLLAELLDS